MKDKERIENVRLRERTGGYHKYVDSAEVHNPDPTSSHFVSGKFIFARILHMLTQLSFSTEQDRFDKDFAVADQKVRQAKFEQVQNKYNNIREDRFAREV